MLKSLPGSLLSLVFPAFCQGCAREGSYLCLPCQNKIESPIHRCPACAKNSLFGRVHDECQNSGMALSGLMVAAEYGEPAIRNLIWQLKYNSVHAISQTLGMLMTDFLIKADLDSYFGDSMVVCVPTHRKRLRFRGFNQAEAIGRSLAKNLNLQFANLLIKSKVTDRQVDLERTKRLKNVKNVFAVNPQIDNQQFQDRSIIIVDDVASTAATLNECARVLQILKPAEIWGLVVARN